KFEKIENALKQLTNKQVQNQSSVFTANDFTYAKVAANNATVKQTAQESSSASTSSISKSITQINSYRQRRLILADSSESSFNSYELRELLNKEFKNQLKVQNAVIAMIIKSQRNQNVVLTTTEHFSADFLQKN